MRPFYHQGARRLQDARDSRRIADRLADVTLRGKFTSEDRQLIESSSMLFLATCDAEGHPDCSYKGGDPGFVRVVGDDELVFPDYDGNGMFRSLGNILVNPAVGLLFIDFSRPRRLRVNGTARLVEEDPLLATYPGATLLVRVEAEHVFPNCPRYIHSMGASTPSPYVPRGDAEPPVPGWKRNPDFCDSLPARPPRKLSDD
jgi:predicted pyridoxine 5'-phosphate oxidase superfamily flavin-nucleotide-binding protein